MDDSSPDFTDDRIQLRGAIVSALVDHRALSTDDVASVVEADTEIVQEQLHLMANTGQIEQRKTDNQMSGYRGNLDLPVSGSITECVFTLNVGCEITAETRCVFHSAHEVQS